MKQIIIGITGNMGVGKTTAVRMLKQMDLNVFECDFMVHQLMKYNQKMKDIFFEKLPKSIKNNEVDRIYLSQQIKKNKLNVRELEKIIYPFLQEELNNFFEKNKNESILILDVPLLFESQWDRFCNKIIVLSAPENILKSRVMKRQNMTYKKYKTLISRQLSQEEKCKKADVIIETHKGFEPVERTLKEIIEDIKKRLGENKI